MPARCTFCTNPLPPAAAYCPRCGSPAAAAVTAPARRRSIGVGAAVGLLAVAAAGVVLVGWFTHAPVVVQPGARWESSPTPTPTRLDPARSAPTPAR